jgi:hypothetical protein
MGILHHIELLSDAYAVKGMIVMLHEVCGFNDLLFHSKTVSEHLSFVKYIAFCLIKFMIMYDKIIL